MKTRDRESHKENSRPLIKYVQPNYTTELVFSRWHKHLIRAVLKLIMFFFLFYCLINMQFFLIMTFLLHIIYIYI